ncbi:MAG TPA: cytidylate kinase-like family protein [Candidatus Eisenbergiella intestinipullorum]|nr:cytidylate kinase-like family protein [Candidatus Eisenbergiella intestinipullorum]
MGKQIHIVTISRQYGAGGSELGLLLSEKLGVPLYNHQILSEMSRRTGIRETVLQAADERMDDYQANRLVEFLPGEERRALEADTVFDRKTLYTIQESTIRQLAENGPCVFVGRLADYALRERKDVLSVFLYAPKEWRIRRLMGQEGLSYDETLRKLRRIDRERRNYCKYYTGGQWDERNRYGYMCNTSSIRLDDIAELICRRMEAEC